MARGARWGAREPPQIEECNDIWQAHGAPEDAGTGRRHLSRLPGRGRDQGARAAQGLPDLQGQRKESILDERCGRGVRRRRREPLGGGIRCRGPRCLRLVADIVCKAAGVANRRMAGRSEVEAARLLSASRDSSLARPPHLRKGMLPDELTMRPSEPKKSGTPAHIPTSEVLQALIDEAPTDHFTLDWLIASLPERSFGVVMLVLAVLAMMPVGSVVPGLLLAIVAAQMSAGRQGPVFPRRIATRPLPTRYLERMGGQAIQVLKFLERAVSPRWPRPFSATKRVIGIGVLLLTSLVLLAPLPLANMPF